MNFTEIAIGGVALIPLIIGLVEFSKKLGVKGNGLIALAFGLGVLFAGAWGAQQENLIPATLLPWVRVLTIALGGGVAAFAAMGNYDLLKRLLGGKAIPISGEVITAMPYEEGG